MRRNKFCFFKYLILATLIIIFSSSMSYNKLLAQQSIDNDIVRELVEGRKKDLKIGFRIQSYPVSYIDNDSYSPTQKTDNADYKGFCNIFADELFEKLKIHIDTELRLKTKNLPSNSEIEKKLKSLNLVKSIVVNFSQSDVKRYGGVIDKKIDIECGANSIRKDRRNEIEFSKAFLQSGISLLATKDNLEKVNSDEKNLGKLRVGVVSGTTTYKWLTEEKNYDNFKLFETRSKAIESLKSSSIDAIDAYVSDYIILKGILEKEPALKIRNYDIYSKYLKDQEYGIVIKKGQSKLKEIIDQTIDSPKVSSEIKRFNDNYSPDSELILYIKKIFSSPLNSFLFGASLSAFIVIILVTPFREKISEFFLEFLKRISPDIIGGLYSLWQLLIKIIFRK